jgi:hypothetical protein
MGSFANEYGKKLAVGVITSDAPAKSHERTASGKSTS